MARTPLTDAPQTTSGEEPSLPRVLETADAVAIMVSSMVGVGILTLPGVVALAFGSPAAALCAWAAGGLVSLAGALVHAELGSRYPRAGGDYVYLREAFGPLPAFLSGWTSFVVGFPGGIAAVLTAASVSFLEAAGAAPERSKVLGLAFGFLAVLTAIHASGLQRGKRFHNLLTLAKIAVVAALACAGWFVGGERPPEKLTGGGPSPAVGALIVFFAYTGWNASAYVAGEIRNPRRTLPRALGTGVLAVTVLYLAVNVSYFRVVPPEKLGRSVNIAGSIASELLGPAGRRAASAAVGCILLASASAMIVTGPRIYYAMACDGLFPRAISRLAPRSRVPARALWLQSLWAVLILLGGGLVVPPNRTITQVFETIVDWTAFAILPFAALTTATIFVLRRGKGGPPESESFLAPAHPLPAVVFVGAVGAVGLAYLAMGLADPSHLNLKRALVSGAIVATGLPVYFGMRKRERA